MKRRDLVDLDVRFRFHLDFQQLTLGEAAGFLQSYQSGLRSSWSDVTVLVDAEPKQLRVVAGSANSENSWELAGSLAIQLAVSGTSQLIPWKRMAEITFENLFSSLVNTRGGTFHKENEHQKASLEVGDRLRLVGSDGMLVRVLTNPIGADTLKELSKSMRQVERHYDVAESSSALAFDASDDLRPPLQLLPTQSPGEPEFRRKRRKKSTEEHAEDLVDIAERSGTNLTIELSDASGLEGTDAQ